MPISQTPAIEAVHHILRTSRQPLDAFFAPQTVAVIGATETVGSVGRTVLENLTAGKFAGKVFAVNPNRASVLGLVAYPRIEAIGKEIDLAVVVTPAATVPGVIDQCVQAGVRGAIIISAGFKEHGAAGAELERDVQRRIQGTPLRIIGPNCLGVMRPSSGLNATFAAAMATAGNVGFISQSGALLTAILDWSLQENVGFSAIVSVGSMLDVGWGDLIDHLGDDPLTRSILIYMESIGDARSFISAAREVSLRKPIIVLKAGRTEAAAKAASSHTGALTGSDDVLDAALRRAGVLRVQSIAELFDMAEVLAKQPRPHGPFLTIVTNAGGPGVLATDALLNAGGQLTQLSQRTIDALDNVLPPHWSHGNPIDILGDADPRRYACAVEIAAKDAPGDGMLVILTPQAMTDATRTAEQLRDCMQSRERPLLASWMGGAEVAAGRAILAKAGVPSFQYPDSAARAFHYMWQYSENLRELFETPALTSNARDSVDRESASRIVQTVRQAGRTLLTEAESKQLLTAYGIPVAEAQVARSESESIDCAQRIGYPVVLKLLSETITHKSDAGGVQLNLPDASAVQLAYRQIETAVRNFAPAEHFGGVTVQPMIGSGGYELILGSSTDPQFGPALLFGSGGQLVEVLKDRALALPPLTTTLARNLMKQTRVYTALRGIRGRPPVDLPRLENLLVRFSQLVVEQPSISQIDINPLLASGESIVALDARVVLHSAAIPDSQLPRPVIRPYPAQYESPWTLRDGTAITIRPIRPEDESLMVKFHETLSEQAVYMRYLQVFQLSQRVAHERLSRLCFIDYDRQIALVAECPDAATGQPAIIGVGRLIKRHGTPQAEFALIVSDRYQRMGLGKELLRRLVEFARDEKLRRVTGDIRSDNQPMRRICEALGFQVHDRPSGDAKAVLDLP